MIRRLIELISESKRTVVLTGAGISTLSGVPDFRGSKGLYTKLDAEKVFDIEWFHRDPTYFYKGMREIIYGLGPIEPNIVHRELARLERLGLVDTVITQNIDALHHRAGSRKVIEIHGSPLKNECVECGTSYSFEWVTQEVMKGEVPRCDKCFGVIKPGITFFGEMLDGAALEGAVDAASEADLMLVLGSSLVVYPAAQLPAHTLRNGGRLVIVNNQPTQYDEVAECRLEDLELAFREIAKEWMSG